MINFAQKETMEYEGYSLVELVGHFLPRHPPARALCLILHDLLQRQESNE
jgi:hypothetical protein